MAFEKFFRIISYLSVLCGFLSLWISGTFGVVITGGFLAVMVLAWFLEDSRWQISERLGTVLIVLAIPVFLSGGGTSLSIWRPAARCWPGCSDG